MNPFFLQAKKKQIGLLVFVWIIVQALLVFQNGIKTDGESLRFIRESHLLLHEGHFSSPVYFFYCIQIFLIGLSTQFFSSYVPVIMLQLLLNLTALILFFHFLYKRCNAFTAWTASACLLICIPFQLYNTFLYTESIFFSLSLLYTIYLLNTQQLSVERIIKLFCFLILLCMTRPSGLFFAAATLIYIFHLAAGHWHTAWRWSMLLILFTIGIVAINWMMKGGSGLNSMRPFTEEHVICDVPTGYISTPFDKQDQPVMGIFDFITQHPSTFIQLSLQKTMAFFGLYRNYYSRGHNFLLMLYFFPLYVMTLIAIIRKRNLRPGSNLFICSVIFFFWLAVIFSCDEWHNRFFLTLTPLFIAAASSVFSKVHTNDIFPSDSHR